MLEILLCVSLFVFSGFIIILAHKDDKKYRKIKLRVNEAEKKMEDQKKEIIEQLKKLKKSKLIFSKKMS